MIKNIFVLIRPHQYTKNLFVFLPAFFSSSLQYCNILRDALLAFLTFCCVASAVYVLNDWMDRQDDQLHPVKKSRPIASGAISGSVASCLLLLLLIAAGTIGYFLSLPVFSLIVGYFVLNVLYSIKLKHIPIVDVVVIAVGFVLRLFVGAEATGVYLVNWIIVTTFLLALFLALAKRRDDVLLCEKTNKKMRKVMDGYNLRFLDASIIMTGAIVILAYILWSISPEVMAKHHSEHLYLTSIFVIIGILRYMQITFVEEQSGNPTKILLYDRALQCSLLGWLLSFVFLFWII